MKRMICAVALACACVLPSSLYAKDELVVYIYDSLDWIKKSVIPAFEKSNNCTVKIVKFSDAGNIVARLKLEKKNPAADCVLGLTPSLVFLAKKESLLAAYRSKALSKIKTRSLLFDPEYAAPFDYGALAFVYDPSKFKSEPKSFADILALKKGLIIQDPRSSSTGQDFLLWTVSAYGSGWKDFWKNMKGSVLTVAPGWGESFSKFEAGEAPVMLSYATDGAYSWQNYKSFKYKAFIPSEGGFLQIESASVVKGGKHAALAGRFIDTMLSEEVQKEIPLNQWMFPAVDVKLPECFDYAVRPVKVITADKKTIESVPELIKEWEEIFK
jgi:thiamine transport system substrate-binding protein